MSGHRAAVVAAFGPVTGIVGEGITVVPDMSPRRTLDLMGSKAVVAEVGGMLAHLAIVSREQGKTMMVLPKACALLTPGMRVTLDPARCEIRIES